MSIFVKICGLKNKADVKAAVDAGANAVGFVFADSVRRVSPQEAAKAAEAIPPGVRRVAVMRRPSVEDWREVLVEFEPDILQTDIEDFVDLDVPDSVERWPVVREGHHALEKGLPGTFLYEGTDSGTGQTVDWQDAAAIATRGRMVLAGGLSPDNVGDAIAEVSPWAVDVSSGVEAEPGKKDPELIKRFIDAARAAGEQS